MSVGERTLALPDPSNSRRWGFIRSDMVFNINKFNSSLELSDMVFNIKSLIHLFIKREKERERERGVLIIYVRTVKQLSTL